MTDAVPGFDVTMFAYGGWEHEVYQAGDGPGVVVIHEVPGLHPGGIAFGRGLPDAGYPVQGIPTPVSGSPQEQTLKIEMPWPPPSPGAPIYIWLRGENTGRLTAIRY